MVTESQKAFFRQLVGEKSFPAGSDTQKLVEEFDQLDKKSASAWIERALQLPKATDEEREFVAPKF